MMRYEEDVFNQVRLELNDLLFNVDFFLFFLSFFRRCLLVSLLVGDDVCIYWYENGDLIFTKNHSIHGIINQPELNKILLDAFVHPDFTVADELADTIDKHLPNIMTPDSESESDTHTLWH
jgi:hypothetical protein